MIHYFIIKGTHGYPASVQMGLYSDGKKVRGSDMLPDTLNEKTFKFDTLHDMERYNCPCGKPGCLYRPYLLKAIAAFRAKWHKL